MGEGIEKTFSVLRGTNILLLGIVLILMGVFMILYFGDPVFSNKGFIFVVVGIVLSVINFKLRVSAQVRKVKTDYK